mgnify:CR=1 FL=1
MAERNDGKILGVKVSWELIRRAELDLLKKLENWLNSSEDEREKMKEDIEKAMKTVEECYRIVQEYPVPEDFYWSQVNSLSAKTEAKLNTLSELFLKWKSGKIGSDEVKKEFQASMEEFDSIQREIDEMIRREEEMIWREDYECN